MPDVPYIVYCRCAYSQEVPTEVKDGVLAALSDSGAAFQAVPDLCELAARRDPVLARWAAREDLRVVACHSRAVRWLFHAAGAELAEADGKVLDMKTRSAEEVITCLVDSQGSPAIAMAGHQDPSAPSAPAAPDAALKVVLYEGPGTHAMEAQQRKQVLAGLLDAGYAVTRAKCPCGIEAEGSPVAMLACFDVPPSPMPGDAEPGVAVVVRDVSGRSSAETIAMVEGLRESLGLAKPGQWVPWFPVIDYDRCVGCRQCAGFCIFGVYRVADGQRVEVAQPDHCKTNCPACARMCPQVAIIFPKYASAPIDGSPVDEAGVKTERAGTDLKQALQGDVYAVLRNRGAGGGGAGSQAAPSAEALAAAAAKAGIPPRVLMSLNVADPPAAPAKKAPCACKSEACGAGVSPASGEAGKMPAPQASPCTGSCGTDAGCDCDCGDDGDCGCDDDCACHGEGPAGE